MYPRCIQLTLEQIGLNCEGPLICGIFSTNTHYLPDLWWNPWMQNSDCEVTQRFLTEQRVGTSNPELFKD